MTTASDSTADQALVPRTKRAGQAQAFDRLDAPTPGTYWRLRKACKARNDNRMKADAMDAGTVLMLANIEHADGAPHVYIFAPHPGRANANKTKVHSDDFFKYFEQAPDGEAVRARELFALTQQMEETRAAMLSSPPDAVPAALLGHAPGPVLDVPGQALATVDQVEAMTQYAERLTADAEARSQWIQTHSKQLGRQGELLAQFHTERAEAALAKAKAQLHGVAALLRTVDNLRLYTGQDVELLVLRDGAPAAPEAKLTIYQDVLSFDEELLINLDCDGLDHRDVEEVAQALADPALLARLIPAERGMTLVRFRNNYKEFLKVTAENAATAVGAYNAAMNRESQRNRLLVRDGERLFLLDMAPLEDIKQLLPSGAEQDEYFTRKAWFNEPPERITREDLDYAKAQAKQLGALDSYGKILITLMGLHDRTGLFEGAAIPRFANWLDPAFQMRYLQLLSLDNLLGVTRPPFNAWQETNNAYLAAGAWVAVDLREAYTSKRAPGAFNKPWSSDAMEIYEPILPSGSDDVLIERVRSGPDGPFVEVKARYRGYNDVTREQVTIKVLLHDPDYAPAQRIGRGVLVLDRVRASELTYYLESREQRRAYASYIRLFRQARPWVMQRDAHEAPLRQRLHQAVLDAQLPHDPALLPDAITDALAVARTARRDRTVPAAGDAGFKAYVDAALRTLHALLSNHDARVASIDAWAERNGREPLRLVLTGSQQWQLYLVPTAVEHDARLGPPAHASVGRVEFRADGEATVEIVGRRLLRAVAGEQLIHDWNREEPADLSHLSEFMRERTKPTRTVGAAEWLGRVPTFPGAPEDAVAVLDQAIAQSANLAKGLDLPLLVARAHRHMREANRKYVERLKINVPIGSLLYGGKPEVLVASIDALEFAFHAGDDAVKQACREAVKIYQRREEQLAKLEASKAKWRLMLMPIAQAAKGRDLAWIEGEPRIRLERDDCATPDGKAKKGSAGARVMAVTAQGVALFPWLADVTVAPLG